MMKITIVFLALIAVSVYAQGTSESICDRYSRALSFNNTQLVSFVVGAVVTNVTNSTSLLYPFFDGSGAGKNSSGIANNFLTNTAAATILVAHLVQFFGNALGCTDGSIPAYTGNSNMQVVHQNMLISQQQQDYFVAAVVDTMVGAGVNSTDATTVYNLLHTFDGVLVKNSTTTSTAAASTSAASTSAAATTSAASTSAAATTSAASTSAAATTSAASTASKSTTTTPGSTSTTGTPSSSGFALAASLFVVASVAIVAML